MRPMLRIEEIARGQIGKTGFANALGAGQNPRMVQTTGLDRLHEGGNGLILAKQKRGLARMGRNRQAIIGGGIDGHHYLSSLRALIRPESTCQISFSTASAVWVASITTQRSGSDCAIMRN